jgi:hypothetical protein
VTWKSDRQAWNRAGECAREACRDDIVEERYYNKGSDLLYCKPCAFLINDRNLSGEVLCTKLEDAHDLVSIDQMVDYGECPTCGAEHGQQCSTPPEQGEFFGTEHALMVHRTRAMEWE